MAESTALRLRSLIPSATELYNIKQTSGEQLFPQWFIEDYLNLFNNLITLSEEIDIKNDSIKNTTLVTTSPYGILATDEEIYYNTNAGDIIAQLPEGIDGTNFRHISTGENGFRVILTPFGTESLFGENETEYIADAEALLTTFETIEGWW